MEEIKKILEKTVEKIDSYTKKINSYTENNKERYNREIEIAKKGIKESFGFDEKEIESLAKTAIFLLDELPLAVIVGMDAILKDLKKSK